MINPPMSPLLAPGDLGELQSVGIVARLSVVWQVLTAKPATWQPTPAPCWLQPHRRQPCSAVPLTTLIVSLKTMSGGVSCQTGTLLLLAPQARSGWLADAERADSAQPQHGTTLPATCVINRLY
jgi:hypothetical protein